MAHLSFDWISRVMFYKKRMWHYTDYLWLTVMSFEPLAIPNQLVYTLQPVGMETSNTPNLPWLEAQVV